MVENDTQLREVLANIDLGRFHNVVKWEWLFTSCKSGGSQEGWLLWAVYGEGEYPTSEHFIRRPAEHQTIVDRCYQIVRAVAEEAVNDTFQVRQDKTITHPFDKAERVSLHRFMQGETAGDAVVNLLRQLGFELPTRDSDTARINGDIMGLPRQPWERSPLTKFDPRYHELATSVWAHALPPEYSGTPPGVLRVKPAFDTLGERDPFFECSGCGNWNQIHEFRRGHTAYGSMYCRICQDEGLCPCHKENKK